MRCVCKWVETGTVAIVGFHTVPVRPLTAPFPPQDAATTRVRNRAYSVEKVPLKCGACPDSIVPLSGDKLMMGERTVMQEALFYSFRIEDHVPTDRQGVAR